MLKLIATDMDGTLLNNKKEMPKTTFDLVNRLHERGTLFAVASGRQHFSLQKLYGEIKDDIIIVAGNGSIIINKGEIISVRSLDMSIVKEIIELASVNPDLRLTLCGLKSDYMFENNVEQVLPSYLVESHFPVRKIIHTIDELPDDEQILQIAILDPENNSRANIYEPLKVLSNRCHLAISGSEWVDIIALGVNKGVAINELQKMLDASYEETMVFGDELNDIEMMQQAFYSYAMENAVSEIKKVSRFLAPSNENEGVIKIIENFLAMTS